MTKKDDKDPAIADLDRRGFLGYAASLGAAFGASLVTPARAKEPKKAPPGSVEYPVPDDPTKVPGRPAGANGGYGTRSQFEDEVRWRDIPTAYRSMGVRDRTQSTMTPLQDSAGIVTPSGLHFERHHGGIPTIDPARHKLLIHGLVEQPLVYDMTALRRYPSVSSLYFVECSGNSANEYDEYKDKEGRAITDPDHRTAQEIHGLTSCSEWTGVPLRRLLEEVGVRDGADWVIAEGADAAVMTRSIPMYKCLDDALLAYAQNGEALRPEQGYPLRLILPGFEGNSQIKWLRRLEVTDQPAMSREETSRYTDPIPDGKALQFTFVMHPKSVITFPSGGQQLKSTGYHEITGLAWSGQGKVERVDISVDGGRSWQPATMQEPVLPRCHTRFRFAWQWNREEVVVMSRCTDETGDTQPTRAELIERVGSNHYYHYNAIQAWRIDRDGKVENYHAKT